LGVPKPLPGAVDPCNRWYKVFEEVWRRGLDGAPRLAREPSAFPIGVTSTAAPQEGEPGDLETNSIWFQFKFHRQTSGGGTLGDRERERNLDAADGRWLGDTSSWRRVDERVGRRGKQCVYTLRIVETGTHGAGGTTGGKNSGRPLGCGETRKLKREQEACRGHQGTSNWVEMRCKRE